MPEEELIETPQPTEAKAPDWPRIILVAVLGFGLFTGSAYAGYWYGTQQVQQAKIPSPYPIETPETTPSSTPTPTPVVEDETRNWETYWNGVYKYSLKYPSSLEVLNETDGKLELANFKMSEAAHGVFVPKRGFYLVINPQSPEKAIEDFAEGSPYEAGGYEEVSVAGKTASKITSTADVGPDTFLTLVVIYIPADIYTYVLHFGFYEEDAWKFAPLVDQILSTFKFLD